MSRIWSMMDVGKRSLMNNQTALQTVAHNVANRSTEGYSRQRVDFKANEPIGTGKLRIGMGARANEIQRINNEYLEKQIEREGNNLGYTETRAEILGRVEQVYNEQINKGLNQYMSEFFNAFRELSNNPESLATRTMVKESAEFLTKDFKRINHELKEIQRDADYRILTKVEEINQMTREIAQLNEKISVVELNGVPANDERDRRDVLLKNLSQKVNIRYAESNDGQLTITAGSNAVLVSGFSHRELLVAATPANEIKSEGNFDVFYKANNEGSPVLITNQIKGGEIGGLLQVRDVVANELMNSMDEIAYKLANEVNDAHTQGFDRYNQQAGQFFDVPLEMKGAAENIGVNLTILGDVGRIAAASESGAPGDNRVANILSSLQYKQVMNNNTNTLDDHYNTIVGKIGIETQRALSAHQSQSDMVTQLKNIRESISGVSLDEETTKMIEFQKNFDASARLIRAADEMMDTVLSIKRI